MSILLLKTWVAEAGLEIAALDPGCAEPSAASPSSSSPSPGTRRLLRGCSRRTVLRRQVCHGSFQSTLYLDVRFTQGTCCALAVAVSAYCSFLAAAAAAGMGLGRGQNDRGAHVPMKLDAAREPDRRETAANSRLDSPNRAKTLSKVIPFVDSQYLAMMGSQKYI